ncbi:MAG: hypothetical protein KatS3mg096_872 [Candidatus Parcubacteria bacterium]|nr:MAG: hypothetical protein KatS3mg096_872 [Candidatus Parcubacteria bacterium]
MKKVALLFSFFALILFNTRAANYEMNLNDVDQFFESAEEVNFSLMMSDSYLADQTNDISKTGEMLKGGGKSTVVAFILCTFLGGLAIHRLYLEGPFILVLGYACIPVAGSVAACYDWIMLLIKTINGDGVDEWIGCRKLFTWDC